MVDDFLLIGLTIPGPWDNVSEEAKAITSYLDGGLNQKSGNGEECLDLFHIRKPEASQEYTRELIANIPSQLHNRLVLHSHYGLRDRFDIKSIHLKSSDQPDEEFFNYSLSKSFHTLDEIERLNDNIFRYLFISPVFDSISKQGYQSRFTLNDERLLRLTQLKPLIGLGGVIPSLFQNLYDAKFAGAALLGYLWNPNQSLESRIDAIIRAKRLIAKSI